MNLPTQTRRRQRPRSRLGIERRTGRTADQAIFDLAVPLRNAERAILAYIALHQPNEPGRLAAVQRHWQALRREVRAVALTCRGGILIGAIDRRGAEELYVILRRRVIGWLVEGGCQHIGVTP